MLPRRRPIAHPDRGAPLPIPLLYFSLTGVLIPSKMVRYHIIDL